MRHALLLILFTTLATAGEAEAVKLDPKLPPTVVAEMKDYQSDIDKIQAKAKADTAKRAGELAKVLSKAETDATKKGDLEAALAVKAALEALPVDKLDDLGNRVPAKAQEPSLRRQLNGVFSFNFPNGHKGDIEFRKDGADVPGFHGAVVVTEDEAVVTWSNGTEWRIRKSESGLVAKATDGECALTFVRK